MTRIQDIEDIQGAFLRRILSEGKLVPFVGPITPEVVAEAHTLWIATRPGAPVVHESSAEPVALFVTYGKWKARCPECGCGITSGRAWNEARCFECGAVLRVVWPEAIDAIEAALLERIPRRRHWNPGETVDDLREEARAHGVERD